MLTAGHVVQGTSQTRIAPAARIFPLILLSISAGCAVLYLILGSSQYVEYDGYWHLFIAQLDSWPAFFRDLYDVPHPPLFLFLMKFVLLFGRSLLLYRAIGITCTVSSVFMVGWLARKVTGSTTLGYLAALAYGVSMPVVIMACEVRSYMLSVIFVLLSFSAFLDIDQNQFGETQASARWRFVLWTILACLSEYVALFYTGAVLLLIAIRMVVPRDGRREIATPRRLLLETGTMLPIVLAIAAVYFYGVRLAAGQVHLVGFYYDPRGSESIPAFIARNTQNLLNGFLPFEIHTILLTLILCGIFIAAVVLAALANRTFSKAVVTNLRATLLVTCASLAAIIAAGLAGKYPYGGYMRQQFQLYPFLVLSLAIISHYAAAHVRRYIPAPSTRIAAFAIAGVVVIAGIAQFRAYPKTSTNVLAPEVAAFEQFDPSPSVVYVDQFNLITYFMYHHDWKWRLLPQQSSPRFDVFDVSKKGNHVRVFRDLSRWNADPDDLSLFPQLAGMLQTAGNSSLTIFAIRQAQTKSPFADLKQATSTIQKDAYNAGICAKKLSVAPYFWYATLVTSRCPQPVAPAQSDHAIRSLTDDTNAAITYVGAWSHGKFPEASGSTLSYSNDAGSLFRAEFLGSGITWIYTKAFNRGIADVRIDGKSVGKIDLYSAKIKWRTKHTFSGLSNGNHTLEVVVTGERNPQSQDTFIDLDALVAQ